uniref:FERM domain-containing protein n=1 Tax=Megaselia scalaris TaxID=36166 RepID=T1GKS0_MEGSC
MEYFGFEYWSPNKRESRTHQWINLRNPLKTDSGSNPSGSSQQLMLSLRVKFWVPAYYILQDSVKELFYMQAKLDLIEGRLMANDWENAAKLSALLCQADGIRFNEASLKAPCPLKLKQIEEEKIREEINKTSQQSQNHHYLALKKRRLSKQKSVENLDLHSSHTSVHRPSISSVHSLGITLSSAPTTTPQPTTTSEVDINDIKAKEYLKLIAIEHSKFAKLNMSQKSAKYWLLKEISKLPGYGEEVFSGVTANESDRCDISVGSSGITITCGEEKNSIPFSAIAAAKAFRRTFKLDYVNDHGDRKEFEIKLPKHAIAAGLYRSITERHAFYVCDKVRMVVTNQFTRDLKGTIASMFKEDTELGKRYVFDIQRTCREAHDHAMRKLYERGIEVTRAPSENDADDQNALDKIDDTLKEKEEREAVIERCVESRITEAMT